VYPTRVTTYESVKYPATGHVVLLASDSQSITELMLDDIPTECNCVLKLMGPDDKAVVERRFSLQRETSFLSYTQSAETDFLGSDRVTVSRRLDETLLPFYRANGYERDEVAGYFKAGAAFSFALHENGKPVSACMAYQNHGNIWEICGLYAIERARRKGFAREVVETALHTLRENGHVPRYQMDESNVASRKLAERLGLRRFLTTEHFLCRSAR
jgi:GNAT superfamily N-acetyltransferase